MIDNCRDVMRVRPAAEEADAARRVITRAQFLELSQQREFRNRRRHLKVIPQPQVFGYRIEKIIN